MMQTLASRQTFTVAKTTRATPGNTTTCCMAKPSVDVSRRQAVWIPLLAGVAAAVAPGAAQANSAAPKNASAASMSSFTMEGTKKQGVSPKRKQAVLNKLKESIAARDLS